LLDQVRHRELLVRFARERRSAAGISYVPSVVGDEALEPGDAAVAHDLEERSRPAAGPGDWRDVGRALADVAFDRDVLEPVEAGHFVEIEDAAGERVHEGVRVDVARRVREETRGPRDRVVRTVRPRLRPELLEPR